MTEEIVNQRQSQLYDANNELARLHNEQATVEQSLDVATRKADTQRIIELTERYNQLPFITKAAQVKVATANVAYFEAEKQFAMTKLQAAQTKEGADSEQLRKEIEQAEILVADLYRQRLNLESASKFAQSVVNTFTDRVINAKHALESLVRQQTNREKTQSSQPEYNYFGKPIMDGELASFDN